MKIKLSKSQWEMVGRTAGWMKKEAQGYNMNGCQGVQPEQVEEMNNKALQILAAKNYSIINTDVSAFRNMISENGFGFWANELVTNPQALNNFRGNKKIYCEDRQLEGACPVKGLRFFWCGAINQ